MSLVEANKLIKDKVPLTLKRNNESGYFLLKPFLPLLQQHSVAGGVSGAVGEGVSEEDLSVEQEDVLLSRYGILVDTNDAGEKWITGDKALELLRMLDLLHLFEDEFDFNHKIEEMGTSKLNGHAESDIRAQDPEIQDSQDGLDSSVQENKPGETVSRNKSIKRVSKDLELGVNPQKELGSPLKKLRLQNESSDGQHNELLAGSKSVSVDETSLERPIYYLYSHDMENIPVPLQIRRAQATPFAADNNQRMKLETFLQRLLFPAVQDVASSSSPSSFQTAPFETLLQEVDTAFPHTQLNINIPVDERGNTPLHWLASIANLDLVKKLVEHGSNRLLGDNIGESALVKAVKSVNNYDSGTFEELLDYLYPCLMLEDTMNRTVLHHIVITSGMAGCAAAAKYYLDILMGWIVKKQSRPIKSGERDAIIESLDLKWMIANMLNATDSNGDTCLNIASRLGNVAIVDALLDYGADPYVANKSGLRPVDFGAGTTKLNSNGVSGVDAETSTVLLPSQDHSHSSLPDTMSLINSMHSLLSTVSQDYNAEVKEHQEKLNKLHKELNSHREFLAASRDRLAHAKQLQDEHALLKEQLASVTQGIVEEGEKFQTESKELGLTSEDAAGADWDSSEFDADEPFRVDFIYNLLERKLSTQYNGDIDKLLAAETLESVLDDVRSKYEAQNDNGKLDSLLPPAVLLKARIHAYKRNEKQLDMTLQDIQQKQKDLEGKFRRVLCLCLKIDEDKVDDMLDGLLQAISSEDPQDVDTDEMQGFLKKHNV